MLKKAIGALLLGVLILCAGCVQVGSSSLSPDSSGVGSSNVSAVTPDSPQTSSQIAPRAVGLSDFERIIIDGFTWFGLTSEGDLYAWGDNSRAQTGAVGDNRITTPVKVELPEPVTDAAPGSICVALGESGTVYTWGIETADSDGIYEYYSAPAVKELPETAVAIYQAHGQVGAVKGESGALYLWGWNYQQQLMGKSDMLWTSEVFVADLPSEAVKLSGYDTHLIALCEDGKVYTWGDNAMGQLGDGGEVKFNPVGDSEYYPDVSRAEALPVAGISGRVIDVAAGRAASYALTAEGDVYAWGSNDVGQLGIDEGTKYSSTPIKIEFGQRITAVASADFSAYAIGEDGSLYGWGRDVGVATESAPDTQAQQGTAWTPQRIAVADKVTRVSVGRTSFAFTEGGLWSWGGGANAAIGYNSADGSPVKITAAN